jgi:site-specific DNA-cytosine methylase
MRGFLVATSIEEADEALDGEEVLEAVGDYPVYIDLFAGVGGVCRGVYRYPCARPACDVIGIDIDGSKAAKYPGYFVQHDLSEGLPEFIDELEGVDLAWASPECTFATGMQFARSGENLIPMARDLLAEIGAEATVIENVPDVFHTGHVHKLGYGKYHNVLALNSGCWQAQTAFQKSVNIDPDAGFAPIVDLDTLDLTVRKFA